MKTLRSCLALAVAFMSYSFTATAQDAPAAYGSCVACHGAAGEGNVALNSPALAGQQSAYIERQLQHFKSGLRGADPKDTLGAQMRGMAATLSDDDITAIASYLSALALPPVKAPASGDLKNGNNYYQANCGACHGGKAEGNAALNSPALASLDTDYLQRQYKNFQSGARGSSADDRYGRQMAMMANSLPSEQDLADVIAFIHSLATGK